MTRLPLCGQLTMLTGALGRICDQGGSWIEWEVVVVVLKLTGCAVLLICVAVVVLLCWGTIIIRSGIDYSWLIWSAGGSKCVGVMLFWG